MQVCEVKIAIYEKYIGRKASQGDQEALRVVQRFSESEGGEADDYRDYDGEVEEDLDDEDGYLSEDSREDAKRVSNIVEENIRLKQLLKKTRQQISALKALPISPNFTLLSINREASEKLEGSECSYQTFKRGAP